MATTATSAVAYPIGAGRRVFYQLSTDMARDQISSPEAYTGAMLGGAIGMNTGSAMTGAAVATATGEMLENVNGVRRREPIEILVDTAFTGAIAAGVHKLIPMIEFDMDYYLSKVLTDYEKNWIDSILSGIVNSIYYEIKDYIKNYSLDYKEGLCT